MHPGSHHPILPCGFLWWHHFLINRGISTGTGCSVEVGNYGIDDGHYDKTSVNVRNRQEAAEGLIAHVLFSELSLA